MLNFVRFHPDLHKLYKGMSLKEPGTGEFSPAIMNMSPGYFHSKIEPRELLIKNIH